MAVTAISVPIFVLLSVAALVSGNEDFKIVQTEHGTIRGKLESTKFDAKPYYAYRGIPYARPPVNDLRFKVSNNQVFPLAIYSYKIYTIYTQT